MDAFQYSAREEKLNILTHAVGIVFSCIATVILIIHASLHKDAWHIVSFSIFGSSLIAMYTASTLYHNARETVARRRLKIMDHAAIFLLIAGTYTPFTLVTLRGTVGWVVFGVVWGIAVVGIGLKLAFIGRFKIASTLLYVGMGWVIIFAVKPLISVFPTGGLIWLFAGGAAYTLGAVFYGIRRIRFNHAVFHIFVLLGSACHVVAVFVYV